MAEGDGIIVIGAGQAGTTLVVSLRERGYTGTLRLIDAEDEIPYQRPPLSKGYLVGSESADDLVTRPLAVLERDAVDYRPGTRVVSIDREQRTVTLSSGDRLGYESLVFATGATPRTLGDSPLDGVLTLRSRVDSDALRDRIAAGGDLVVIGGGFLGLEVAAAARGRCRTTVLERAEHVLNRVVSTAIASHIAADHEAHGTTLRTGVAVEGLVTDNGLVTGVQLVGGDTLPADTVVVAIGASPEVGVAATCDLPVDNGIVVDEYLRTADPHIYAIGDCANYPHPLLQVRTRLESVQNAVDQARYVAGLLMNEHDGDYRALPWFWSHQGQQNLQIAGVASPADAETVLPSTREGRLVVLRHRDGLLTAVETLNSPGDHIKARRLLAGGPVPVPLEGAFAPVAPATA